MAQWDGKSKGTVFGYKIIVFLMRNLGIRFVYIVLRFLAFYYLIFARSGSKASYYYFHKRQGKSKFKSVIGVYKNYYVFAQTILDKIAIKSGLEKKYTFNFDGEEILKDILKEKQGGILISAHVGNFEIAEHFLSQLDVNATINLITTDREHQQLKKYLDSIFTKSNLKFIIIGDDMSHVFEINNALSRNELIVFTGDRYFEGNKVMTQKLLGKDALFPAGPYILASRLRVPVIFVYNMKETSSHYHMFARRANFQNRNQQELLKEYTENIEWILKKFPYQWFNFFDFWKKEEGE